MRERERKKEIENLLALKVGVLTNSLREERCSPAASGSTATRTCHRTMCAFYITILCRFMQKCVYVWVLKYLGVNLCFGRVYATGEGEGDESWGVDRSARK